MIQIVAKRYLREGALSEYTEVAKELVDSSRQEEGCAGYGLYYDRPLCWRPGSLRRIWTDIWRGFWRRAGPRG